METKRPPAVWLLVASLFVLSLGATTGGLVLTLDPSGGGMGLRTEMLAHGPFSNFLIPGLFLFCVLGLVPLVTVLGLLRKFNFPLANRINPYPRTHWAWTASLCSGIILVIWIDIQVAILRTLDSLQFVYSLFGILIIVLTVWPGVMEHYEEKK